MQILRNGAHWLPGNLEDFAHFCALLLKSCASHALCIPHQSKSTLSKYQQLKILFHCFVRSLSSQMMPTNSTGMLKGIIGKQKKRNDCSTGRGFPTGGTSVKHAAVVGPAASCWWWSWEKAEMILAGRSHCGLCTEPRTPQLLQWKPPLLSVAVLSPGKLWPLCSLSCTWV